jgi:hypothetical protein
MAISTEIGVLGCTFNIATASVRKGLKEMHLTIYDFEAH